MATAEGSTSLPWHALGFAGMNNWFVWALLSAVFAALTAILAKVGVAEMNPNLATAIRTTVILVITWALALATGGQGRLVRADLAARGFSSSARA